MAIIRRKASSPRCPEEPQVRAGNSVRCLSAGGVWGSVIRRYFGRCRDLRRQILSTAGQSGRCRRCPVLLYCLVLALGLLTARPLQAAELEIHLSGVSGALQARLESALPPAPLPPSPAGLADARMEAALRLRQALETYGYYDAHWTEQVRRERSGYILTFAVQTGPPVVVRTVTLDASGPGSGLRAVRQLLAVFSLRRGDVLDQAVYEAWKRRILDTFRQQGYAGAGFRQHEIRINRKTHQADIVLAVASGIRYRFGKVTFEGAHSYPRPFLARYLDFKAGDWYSPAMLATTEQNLRDSDRFSEIVVVPDLEHAADGQLPVTVTLKARRPKRLKLGIGYSSDLGADVEFGYDDYNAFRRGRHLHIALAVAQRTANVGVTYAWPVGDQLASRYVAQTSFQHLDLVPYSAEVFDAGFGRDWYVERGAMLGALLSYQKIIYSIGGQTGQARFTLPSLRYSVQHFADPLRPVEGYSWNLVAQGAMRPLLSDADFLQLRARGEWHHLLGPKWDIGLRGEAGTTWLSGPIGQLSPTMRFFAGGQGSLPGYAYLSQGPVLDGVLVGGLSLMVAGVDVERLIGHGWGVVMFYHAGNAFSSFAGTRVLQDVGIGVRWYSPFGPVRLDVAHPLVRPEVPYLRVVFSVGVSL